MRFPIQRLEIELNVVDPPKALYVQGSAEGILLLSRLPEQGLAIVGTRRPQARAEALVRRTVLELRRSELIIVSGLALGIDACAHEAALEAGLPTIAVLGCGLNQLYPRENAELRDEILSQGGLVISEFEPDELPKPYYFLERNRLIAGLSKATWVAQAPFRSGALSTAYWALDQGKHCYVTPNFPEDPPFLGNQKLLDREDVMPAIQAKSFRRTWNDLRIARRGNTDSFSSRGTQLLLIGEIRRRTAQSGGVRTLELLDWAFGQNLNPIEFYEQLQKAQQCGSVSERNGVLVTT